MEVFEQLVKELNEYSAQLIAVSKTRSEEQIMELYNAGQRRFGENRVQELCAKYESLPKDIEWHAIGHLQTNKVKYIAPFVHLIHAVDSLKLMKEIQKEAKKNARKIDVLLQIHIAQEESKFGLDPTSLEELLDFYFAEVKHFPNVNIVGLMGMATFTEDETIVRTEFKGLEQLFTRLKDVHFFGKRNFTELSIGMSGDYKLALEVGSTMVRIGSKLFGPRDHA